MRNDDDLLDFDADGLWLPPGATEARLDNAGASIWYADYGGGGPAVLVLHGGLGHSGNFGKQVPALREAGYRVIAIDSRGHGRSSRDSQPYSYELMATDVIAVMDRLGVARAAIVGWSDGADIGLVMAHDTPGRVAGVFFLACNVDQSGTKPFVMSDRLGHCISRHQKDYAALSATPEGFEAFSADLNVMQRSQPDYSAADLAAVRAPVLVALGEGDEFIKPEHAAYVARSIPGAELRICRGHAFCADPATGRIQCRDAGVPSKSRSHRPLTVTWRSAWPGSNVRRKTGAAGTIMKYDSILGTVGNTPVVRINRLAPRA